MPLPTIAELARELAQGATTSRKLTEKALARAQDPKGEGGRVYVRLFAEAALVEAEASDRLRAERIVPSPLAGIPISVKDLFDVRGLPTTAGSKALRDAPPAAADAPIVARLRAQGAVILGRTNMTEFAFGSLGLNPHYGTPRSIWDRATGRVPGGSSSGAAVSVADGMAVGAIGSDTACSVRLPAALNGLAGFKPTQRRIPLEGAIPLATSLDSVGPLAASVACCALLDAAMAGEPVRVPAPLPLSRLRLAVPRKSFLFDGLDREVAAAIERALGHLSAAGARLEDATFPTLDELGRLAFDWRVSPIEAYAWHKKLLAERKGDYDPMIAQRLLAAAAMPAAEYIEIMTYRRRFIAAMAADTAGFDAWLCPTSPIVAPAIAPLEASEEAYRDASAKLSRNNRHGNFLDGCAVTIPCHREGEAPVGLMLTSRGGEDRALLAAGVAIEAALRE